MAGDYLIDAKSRSRGEVVRASKVSRARRRHELLQLAATGATVEDISRVLTDRWEALGEKGISAKGVRSSLGRIFEQWRQEDRRNVENLIELDAHRLDELLKALWQRATQPVVTVSGDDGQPVKILNPNQMKAVDRVLAIMAQRAKLLGLNAPEKHEHKVNFSLPDEERKEVERLENLWLASGAVDSTAEELPALPEDTE